MGMEGRRFDTLVEEERLVPLLGRTLRETQLQFLTRRAFEENRLASRAATPKAAAAHRYLAAAYAAAIAREMAAAAELEALTLRIA